MQKANYLIVSDYASVNGGCAKVAIDTAVELSKNGKNVIFFAGGGSTCNELIGSNVKVINLNLPDLLGGNKISMIFKGIHNKYVEKKFAELVDSLPIECVIHIHSWMKVLSPSIFKVLHKRKIKFFITAHDYFLICPNGGFYNYKKNCICSNKDRKKCCFVNCDSRNYLIKIWRCIRSHKQAKLLKKCNYTVFTLSNLMKEQFDNYGIKTELLHNPIHMNFDKNKIHMNKKRKFAYIGRLSKEKGVSLFCEALKITNYEGIIFGNGPEFNKLNDEYKDNDNIVFKGWLKFSEITNYFDEIIALVFPSTWYEGAPLIIPEVGSYGIPAIVSDACSGVEYILGNNGDIFKSNDIESLCSAMSKYINMSLEDLYKIRLKTFDETHNYNVSSINYIDNLIRKYGENNE